MSLRSNFTSHGSEMIHTVKRTPVGTYSLGHTHIGHTHRGHTQSDIYTERLTHKATYTWSNLHMDNIAEGTYTRSDIHKAIHTRNDKQTKRHTHETTYTRSDPHTKQLTYEATYI